MTKRHIQYSLHILDNSLDLAWCRSADIALIVRGDFIPLFLQRTSQGGHKFVVLQSLGNF